MSSDDSTTSPAQSKRPEGSPLFWHASRQWAKKIRGKLHYFGRCPHDEALARYEQQKDDLHAGRSPREEDGLTVQRLCAKFLVSREAKLACGELSQRAYAEYGLVCGRLRKYLGAGRLVSDLRPDDFARLRQAMAATWGPLRLKAEIVRSRVPFNWAYKSGLLERPVLFGEEFSVPSLSVIRRHKAERGPRTFTADELRRLVAAASQPLKAMILLGVNCGYGNNDIARLPLKALDLPGGWVTFARPKTGILRRCPLWPETVTALRSWLRRRPHPRSEVHDQLVFVTKYGDAWNDASTITHEMRKLLDKLKIEGARNFYGLRHTTQTIGDASGDLLAVRHIMGHASSDISSTYRDTQGQNRISDDRLRAVVLHLREWLFPKRKK